MVHDNSRNNTTSRPCSYQLTSRVLRQLCSCRWGRLCTRFETVNVMTFTHTKGQERPELTPPQCDPPATPSPALLLTCSTRRSSRHIEYALISLPIILFSTSFEISVNNLQVLQSAYMRGNQQRSFVFHNTDAFYLPSPLAHALSDAIIKNGVGTVVFRHAEKSEDKVGGAGPICLRYSKSRSDWWRLRPDLS